MNAIVAIARENVATMGRQNDARIRLSNHMIVRATSFRALATACRVDDVGTAEESCFKGFPRAGR